MKKHHPKNERIKRRYFDYLKEAKRMDVSSVDLVAASIAAFEQWSNYRDLAGFHIEQAKGFKACLAKQRNAKTGAPLSKATIHSRLMALKAFVFWLAGQPGYRSRISYADADYFNPSANDSRIATARRDKKVPTVEQVRHVIFSMPAGSDVEKRDRAIVAFTLLTGARDNAVASFRLKHVDLAAQSVFQDADDPLFPATKVALTNAGLFGAVGLSRDHWKNASAIRRIFRTAFEATGLPYANPHSLRDTLAMLGEQRCRTPEEFKAWSQNLGHEQVLTTFTSYGTVATNRQADIIAGLKAEAGGTSTSRDEIEQIAALVERMRKKA
mgnify:CR=1 FL=1